MKQTLAIALFSLLLLSLMAQTINAKREINPNSNLSLDNSISIPTRDVVATPVFDPPEGVYCTPQQIEISTATPDATIHYTLDGTDPGLPDPIYAAPFFIPYNSTYTIKAIAYRVGYEPSQIATATYEILNPAYPVEITSEPSDVGILVDGQLTEWKTPHTFWQDCCTDAVYSVQFAGYTWEPGSFTVNHIQASTSQEFVGTLHNPPIVPGVEHTIGGPNFYIASITVQTPPDTGFDIDYETVNVNTIPPNNYNNGLSYHNSYAVIFTGPNNEWFDLAVTVPAGIWWICAWYGDSWHTATPDYPYIGDVPGTVYLMHIQFAGDKGQVYMIVANGPNLDPTLPVELSSFTAIVTASSFVNLTWVTESETEVLGYNVYRAETASAEASLKLNPSLIPATNTSQTHTYSLIDSEVETNNTYYYWLENVDLNNSIHMFGPVSVTLNGSDPNIPPPVIPAITGIKSIYPNPFSPATNITYELAKAEIVKLSIYNIKGMQVCNLLSESKNAGTWHIGWNGSDHNGALCSSGIYYVKMTAGKYSALQKMVLNK